MRAVSLAKRASQTSAGRTNVVGSSESASIGRAHATPGITNLLVMNDRIVDFDLQAEDLRRKAADRRQHRVRRHHPVALGGDKRDARVDEILLRSEHVERGALADAGL